MRLRILWMLSLIAGGAIAQDIPVLTVCEALEDLHRYSGKTVIIVGRSVGTSEGGWLSADCGFKVRNGPRGLNDDRSFDTIISTTYDLTRSVPPQLPRKFKWDMRVIQEKLVLVKKTTKLQSGDAWAAMYGRLETEIQVRVDGTTSSYNIGFGHGSVAAAEFVFPETGYRKLR